MRSVLVGGAIVALAGLLTAVPVVSKPAPPPPPTNVQISNVQVGPKVASFTVTFSPVRIDAKSFYPTYQFITAPKCKIDEPVQKSFPTRSFPGPPFQVSFHDCLCNRSYTASVATFPPDDYTSRSVWANSAPVMIACQR